MDQEAGSKLIVMLPTRDIRVRSLADVAKVKGASLAGAVGSARPSAVLPKDVQAMRRKIVAAMPKLTARETAWWSLGQPLDGPEPPWRPPVPSAAKLAAWTTRAEAEQARYARWAEASGIAWRCFGHKRPDPFCGCLADRPWAAEVNELRRRFHGWAEEQRPEKQDAKRAFLGAMKARQAAARDYREQCRRDESEGWVRL